MKGVRRDFKDRIPPLCHRPISRAARNAEEFRGEKGRGGEGRGGEDGSVATRVDPRPCVYTHSPFEPFGTECSVITLMDYSLV